MIYFVGMVQMLSVMYSPSEPYEVKNDLGDYGISNPSLPVDYGWFTRGRKSLTERKHVPGDLLASLGDGRLNREVQALLENLEKGGRSYLLLEGFMRCDNKGFILNPTRPSGWEIDKVSERISTIQEMGVELLLSPSLSETALVLVSQIRWEMKDNHKSLSIRPGPVMPWGKPSYATYVLWSYQGIPGIGADMAEILYEAAPTWENLVEMSVSDLQELKRFGVKRSESVWKFIHQGKL